MNTTILNEMLAGTTVDVKEFISDATGTVNEGLLRQKLQALGDADGERYKLWRKVKTEAQRAMNSTELAPQDISNYAFKAAGAEHLMAGFQEPEVNQGLPQGSVAGTELVEFEPGKQGYPVTDANGDIIGYDWVK